MGYFIPYYVSSLLTFMLISKGFRGPFWSDVYETATCFSTAWAVIKGIVWPWKATFYVTPKGEVPPKTRLDLRYVLPLVVMFVLLLISLETGAYRFTHAFKHLDATLLSTLWALYNLMVLGTAIIVAQDRPNNRSTPRLSRQIPCRISSEGKMVALGHTVNVSESGLLVSLEGNEEIPQRIRARLEAVPGEAVELQAEVVSRHSAWSGRKQIGIRFVDLNDDEQDAIIRQMYSDSMEWGAAYTSPYKVWNSFRTLAAAPAKGMRRAWKERKTALALFFFFFAAASAQAYEPHALGGFEEDNKAQGYRYVGGGLSHPLNSEWTAVMRVTEADLRYRFDLNHQTVRAKSRITTPTAGIQRRRGSLSLGMSAGASFRHTERGGAITDSYNEKGISIQGEADYWFARIHDLSVLASYSGVDDFFWSRARLKRMITNLDFSKPVSWFAGADVVGMGNEDFHAVQVGAVLERVYRPRNFSAAIKAGVKDASSYSTTPYAGLEFYVTF